LACVPSIEKEVRTPPQTLPRTSPAATPPPPTASAPGLTAEDVQRATEARLIVSPDLKVMDGEGDAGG